MESLDDLLNFSSEEEDDEKLMNNLIPSIFPNGCRELASSLNVLDSDDLTRSSPEFVEEELEWISNKDSFPSVETFVDILASDLSKHHSPVSVLENSTSSSNSSTIMNYCGSLQVPVRPRSKCRRKRVVDVSSQQLWSQEHVKNITKLPPTPVTNTAIGRKCQHCGTEKTPQWRAGPFGPKTLCNACGVRYKSGRLCPEYRPASSPTFSSKLHSNSHRKIMEMKRTKNSSEMMMSKSVDKG